MTKRLFGSIILTLSIFSVHGQMITGVWKGRINRQKTEIKIIRNGDSLTGTSYYYESENNYRRYTIKGYFDPLTNAAVWWDDQLIEEKTGRINLSSPGKNALLARADFNCPGSGKMMLDGKATLKEDDTKPRGDVHLDKTETSVFKDEWDYVIDNYTSGTNDPEIIASTELIALEKEKPQTPNYKPQTNTKQQTTDNAITVSQPRKDPPAERPVTVTVPVPEKQMTIEEKFISRKKVLTKEIPVYGDSVELRFYDNAEIDGDSISLFLNDQLIFQHIRLLGSAYIIKLAVSSLKETNELIMVAENLGAIPPNTSYMVAIVGEQRYDARLESTKGSSAMVRFIKKM